MNDKAQTIIVPEQRHVAARNIEATTDAGQVLQMLSRASSDPNTDIDKLERLMAMYERVTAKNAEAEYAKAMSEAQSEMTRVSADALNPQTKSRYASYAALDRALRPIYTKHGFSLSYDTAEGAPPDEIRMVCHVSHISGHCRSPHIDIPADGKGAKGGDVMSMTHARGAGSSYGMRYLLKMIFNVAIGEDDNDGNLDEPDHITMNQILDLKAKIEEVGAGMDAFLKVAKVEKLDDIHADRYRSAIDWLNRYAKENTQ
jgi:hypothetical protein